MHYQAAPPRTPVQRRRRKAAATPQSHGKKRRRSAESPKDEELPVPDDPEFNPEAIVFCFRTESSLVGNTAKAFPNSAM